MSPRGADPLLAGLAAGREEAFTALYDRYAGRMLRAALGWLTRREDAEDAVQEVFTALVRSRRKLAGVNDLAAYLFTALRRAAGRIAERRGREPAASEAARQAVQPADRPPEGPRAERVARALRALPAEQREVIGLKIDGGLTFGQIAEVTGVSPNTAASRYRYALEKLQAALPAGEVGGSKRSATVPHAAED